MTFAFYDLETTGLSPAFDQPLQFAAILTDGEFREIKRVNLRCRIAPHIIPSPWALAVTGVRPAQLLDAALPTLFEFTQEIGALIDRWSPAIRTGFNSIRFDEEMLRQASSFTGLLILGGHYPAPSTSGRTVRPVAYTSTFAESR